MYDKDKLWSFHVPREMDWNNLEKRKLYLQHDMIYNTFGKERASIETVHRKNN